MDFGREFVAGAHPVRAVPRAAIAEPDDGGSLESVMLLLANATDAAGGPGFAAALADLLQCAGGCENMMIAAFFDRRPPRPVFSNLSERDARTSVGPYFADAYRGDPFVGLLEEGVEEGVFHLDDYIDGEFTRSRYYREYYCYTRIRDECAVVVRPNDDAALLVSLGLRSERRILAGHLATLRLILPCVRALCRRHWVGLGPGPEAPTRRNTLSRREREVGGLVLEGRSNKEIARLLGLSPETVKVYRKRMNRKLDVSSPAGLVRSLVGGGEACTHSG